MLRFSKALATLKRSVTTLALAAASWGAIALVMAAALVLDKRAKGVSVDLPHVLLENWQLFLPLILLSWALQHWFSRPGGRDLNLERILQLLAVTVLGFIPLYILFQTVVFSFEKGVPLEDVLARQSRFGWWMDLVTVLGAFGIHVAIAARSQALEKERSLLAERAQVADLRLSLLQSQLQPHFLFNALNSIASLVRSGDRGDALTALTTVSDLLRFALRASNRPWVAVSDEVAFIDAYLSIQQLRLGQKLQIDRQIAAIDWANLRCPPLLFQPLVENAVRHGIEAGTDSGTITIRLTLDDNVITLLIENPLLPSAGGNGHGMGLTLTQQRLDVLYKGAATLQAKPQGDHFQTMLTIPAEDLGGQPVCPHR